MLIQRLGEDWLWLAFFGWHQNQMQVMQKHVCQRQATNKKSWPESGHRSKDIVSRCATTNTLTNKFFSCSSAKLLLGNGWQHRGQRCFSRRFLMFSSAPGRTLLGQRLKPFPAISWERSQTFANPYAVKRWLPDFWTSEVHGGDNMR